MKIFNLPDLGEGLAEGEIREWYVKVGDEIKADQPMVSMETAKAVVDVPAPRSGRIEKLYGKAGDIILTHAPLVEFTDDENSANVPIAEDSGTVVGSMEVSDRILEESPMGVRAKSATKNPSVQVLPAMRALAKRLSVDLNTVTGTGPGGKITEKDIENAAQQSSSCNTTCSGDQQALRGVRRAMVGVMQQSHQQVVPVTLVDDADIHAWPQGTDITLRVIRAIIAACKKEPALNVWFNATAMSRTIHDKINLGMAMDSDEGLFVPVLKDIANLSRTELRTKIDTFKQQVKTRTIPQEDLQGATITISNFGTIAGRYANPVIVPPCVAIIGTGRIRQEATPHHGKIEIHKIMPLSLSVDHRVITGGEAARFLGAMIADLQAIE